ncbi:hypothetical protein B0H10DRAFT_2090137, partial [Mycena sp. CBHHK59/15]
MTPSPVLRMERTHSDAAGPSFESVGAVQNRAALPLFSAFKVGRASHFFMIWPAHCAKTSQVRRKKRDPATQHRERTRRQRIAKKAQYQENRASNSSDLNVPMDIDDPPFLEPQEDVVMTVVMTQARLQLDQKNKFFRVRMRKRKIEGQRRPKPRGRHNKEHTEEYSTVPVLNSLPTTVPKLADIIAQSGRFQSVLDKMLKPLKAHGLRGRRSH